MDPKGPKKLPVVRRLAQMAKIAEQGRPAPRQETGKLKPRKGFYSKDAKLHNPEDVPYPLTKEEALEFVQTRLNIPYPEHLAARDRAGFLDRIAEGLEREIPFTNMHFHHPTPLWDQDGMDHKRLMLTKEGGPCWIINPFTKALLECFGYRCHHIVGHARGAQMDDIHIATVVDGATGPGSLHLIDPGTWWNLSAPISLDFERESPVYEFRGTKVKFFKEGPRLLWCFPSVKEDPDSLYSSGQAWRKRVVYYLNESRNWHTHVELSCRVTGSLHRHHQTPPPFDGLIFTGYLKGDTFIHIQASHDSIATRLQERDGTVTRGNMTRPDLLRLFRDNFPQYSEGTLQEVLEALKDIPPV